MGVYYLLNSSVSSPAGVGGASVESAKDGLLPKIAKVEQAFQDFLESKKKEVKKTFSETYVQKLSRSKVRKNLSFKRKGDMKDATIRYAVFTVSNKKDEVETRPVFDHFKAPLIWDKVISMMSGKALENTGEKAPGSSDGKMGKFSQMLDIVMKDSGLGKIKIPGQFATLTLMSEDVIFYWDVIHKKCPSKIRKSKGIKNCVKGLFLGEIDRKNLVRDFANEVAPGVLSGEDVTRIGILGKDEDQEFFSNVYPASLHSDSKFAAAFHQLISRRLPQFYQGESDRIGMILKSQTLPHSVVAVETPDRVTQTEAKESFDSGGSVMPALTSFLLGLSMLLVAFGHFVAIREN